jgi:hypothetical protein
LVLYEARVAGMCPRVEAGLLSPERPPSAVSGRAKLSIVRLMAIEEPSRVARFVRLLHCVSSAYEEAVKSRPESR